MAKITPPNYTQTPNIIFDELMADMTNAELRVVLAIARKTFGWHKEKDLISLTQLEAMTGLSRQGVINGIKAGEKRGLIKREKHGSQQKTYRLLVHELDSTSQRSRPVSPELVNVVDQFDSKLVNVVDTQKKGTKERIQKKEGTPENLTLLEAEPVEVGNSKAKGKKSVPPAVEVYKEVFSRYPLKDVWGVIEDTVGNAANNVNGEKWRAVCKAWQLQGYKPMNITGLLDWYRNGIPDYAKSKADSGALVM